MNSSRVISAIAALAIGFGVTIVGVNASDDPGDASATATGNPGDSSQSDDEPPRDFDAGDDESVSGEVSGEADAALPGERFPCSDEAFGSLLDDLGDLEQTALATDADVFVRVIARRLARFGTASVEDWETGVRGAFDRFVEADGCSALEDAFVDGDGAEFFCAAANVSADDGLFVYLDDAVPNLMEGCQYDPEEGVT